MAGHDHDHGIILFSLRPGAGSRRSWTRRVNERKSVIKLFSVFA